MERPDVLEGWLKMKTEKAVSSWQKRYFKLQVDDSTVGSRASSVKGDQQEQIPHKIYYYKSREDSIRKTGPSQFSLGFIDVKTVSSVKVLDANKDRQFEVTTPSRTYLLQGMEKGERNSVKGMIAEDEELDYWAKGINEWKKYLETKPQPPVAAPVANTNNNNPSTNMAEVDIKLQVIAQNENSSENPPTPATDSSPTPAGD